MVNVKMERSKHFVYTKHFLLNVNFVARYFNVRTLAVFFIPLFRDVFRTMSNIFDEVFLEKWF